MTLLEALEEWRAARQDIFNNTTKVSEDNTVRWNRLAEAEHKLMEHANASPKR